MNGLADNRMVGINHRPAQVPSGKEEKVEKQLVLGSCRTNSSVCPKSSDLYDNLSTNPMGNWSLVRKS